MNHSHVAAVIATIVVLGSLAVAVPYIESPDKAAERAADLRAQRDSTSGHSAGVEGPSGGPVLPAVPSADSIDGWIGETRVFTGGPASTVQALAITEDVARPSRPWSVFDGNPTKVFDIDGDGTMEILAQNDDHRTFVFDSRSGRVLAELGATVPAGWEARSFNGPEAAVLERGGAVHVVTANSASVIAAHRFDRNASTEEAFAFEKVWEVRVDDCHEHSGMDARVVLADLTLDGTLEILAATEEAGLYALRHDGSLLWKNCLSGGNAAPTVADVTGDGWPDVVHVSDGGTIALLNGRTGDWIWGFEILEHFDLHTASIPVQAAVGRLSGGPGLDIVVGARDSHDTEDWSTDHALLLALDRHGEILWAQQDPEGNPLTYTRPIIVDADGDGENEVYWGDWNTVGHNPPRGPDAWDRTGPANYYRYSTTGELAWKQTLWTWWSNKDLAIGDVDGDGVAEVLANGPDHNGTDGVWYLDVRDGSLKAWVPLGPWKAQRGPVLADLWGTSTTQWVIQAGRVDTPGQGLLVFDTQVPHRPVWPHPPQATPEADFEVTFSEVSGNEWWVQLRLQTSGARPASVELRTTDAPWAAMDEEPWGWSASGHVPDGTILRFRVTSTFGDEVLGGCYHWTDATPVDCPKAWEQAE